MSLYGLPNDGVDLDRALAAGDVLGRESPGERPGPAEERVRLGGGMKRASERSYSSTASAAARRRIWAS